MSTEERKLVELAYHLRTYGECAPGGDETWAQWDADAECYLRRGFPDDQRCCSVAGEKDHSAFPHVAAAREAAMDALLCATTMIHHMGHPQDRLRLGFDLKGHPPNCPAHRR
jgi:hypothetical protein